MSVSPDPRLPRFLDTAAPAAAAATARSVDAAAAAIAGDGGPQPAPAGAAPVAAPRRHPDDDHVVDFPARPARKTIFRAPPPSITGPPGPTMAPPKLVAGTGRGRAATNRRPQLGAILVAQGALSAEDLAEAIDLQHREEARFGDILLARGMVTEADLYRGLAQQYRCVVADLAAEPPDTRLIDALGAEVCIRRGIVPWKRVGGATVVICSRPAEFPDFARWLPESFGPVRLAVAPERDIQSALIGARHRALAGRAETRVAAAESCRSWQIGPTWRFGAAVLASITALTLLAPVLSFALLTAWAALTLTVNTGLKVGAAVLYHRDRRARAAQAPAAQAPAADVLRLPTVSILVPLYREREIAGRLVRRLAQIDYPRELLDICLIVEADDTMTRAALAGADLPHWMRQVTVPQGAVRTKPRALNFALDFCRGSIIGVYDAEDAPEPSQIHKVVRRFAERGLSLACLQGVLDFYNPRENWLARAFAIEYAAWFRITLPGLEKMGFAVPLGGTTLFFRRAALEELGGWDAHNVTEDADLGIRLARHGYRTELIDTVTKEEANCRPWPWVKQRSRWIKGYAMTWGVHMRDPRRLLVELGPRKFLGVQFLFLGTLSQFLLAPLLWSFWLLAFGLPHPLQGVLPPAAFWTLGGIFALSELLTIVVGMMAVADDEHRFLMKWVPTLHVYWPLASVAAIKGVIEIATDPFYWDKTSHGHLHRDHDIWGVNRPFRRWRNRA